MEKLTTQIKREYLREIVAGRKKVEYRDIKPYWEHLLHGLKVPFRLRLINGMTKVRPEVTVEIRKLVRNTRRGTFDLHISHVVSFKNWDRRREVPRNR